MDSTPMAQRAKKYRELDSRERANYWALMNIVSTFNHVFGRNSNDKLAFLKSIDILSTNLNIELFSDDEAN